MRLLSASILLVLYLIALCRPLAPFLDYKVNRDFFAEVLCVNKSNPELNCEGQCALILKLKQTFDEETQPAAMASITRLADYPINLVSLFAYKHDSFTVISKDYPDAVIGMIVPGHISEVLRPPCVA